MTPQYRIIVDAAGWVDVSARGRLRFEGAHAASFLHALVTNDVESLVAGRGTYAAWLTPQGRMLTDLRLLRLDSGVLAEVPDGLAVELRDRFDQLVFSEDVVITDVTADSQAWLVVGGRAAESVAAAVGAESAAVEALSMFGHLTAGDVRVIRVDDTALPSYEVWASPAAALERTASELISGDLLEALRIEAGRPKFGVDMTAETIPLEAGLLGRAISQSKGCYVGQEVIVRVLHRGGGKVAKRLVRLTFDEGVSSAPAPGEALLVEGTEGGRVTSAAVGPASGRIVALGYLRRESAEVGSAVQTASGAAASVTAFAG